MNTVALRQKECNTAGARTVFSQSCSGEKMFLLGSSAVREATSVGVNSDNCAPSCQVQAAEPALPDCRRAAPSGGSAVRKATSVGAIWPA